jgi:Tfp pilus assembly protein FimT
MMILPIGSKQRRNVEAAEQRAFTLIEFILVMAMLLAVFGVAMPTLSNFFRGRNLDSEARRFISLTRYAQSRAVSESMPMVLWMDAKEGTYGLEEEQSSAELDSKSAMFEVEKELEIEVAQISSRARQITAMPQSGRRNTPMIRFQPDGFVSENSPENIWIREVSNRTANEIWIALKSDRSKYEIQTNVLQNAQR